MKKSFDVIVIGGGFAGVCAAVAARREGLDVLLVDRNNCLGGAATECLVNPFMRFWLEHKDKSKEYLSSGIFTEINQSLSKMNAITSWGCFDEEFLKIVLNRLVVSEKINLLLNTSLVDAEAEAGKLKKVTLFNKSGKFDVTADFFIDASGDGDLAAMAGCDFKLGREEDGLCQPMTLCFRAAGIDLELFRKEKPQMQQLYKQYREEGKIKNIRENILNFATMQDGVVHFNSTRIIKCSPIDGEDITVAEIEAREQAFELVTFLRENFESCKNAKIISTASRIGVRESRKIIGEYTLTADDVFGCVKFDDGIAVCDYSIDIHNPSGTGTYQVFLEYGTYYNIPYRCLTPKDSTNLLVAGRCISSTHEAQASYRIMPTCACIGQAAGIAVGIAKKCGIGVKEVDTSLLRKRIVECGGRVE